MDDCISRQAALNPNIKVSGLTTREAEIVKGISKAYMGYLKRLPAANVIPAPPPHGRLIDADALAQYEANAHEELKRLYHGDQWLLAVQNGMHEYLVELLQRAPTVIPATKGAGSLDNP